MKFTRQLLQKIREKNDIVEIINGYTKLQQRGDRWWGLSPFKNEKTPSFSVKPDDGFYYCFATQKGGDIFRFVGEMEGLTFPETVEYLAERAGIALETTPEDEEADKKKRALYELYERVTNTFRYFLVDDTRGASAREYLDRRGIDSTAVEKFELGFAPSDGRWLYRFLQSKSYSPAFLDMCGLFSRNAKGYSLFRNRVIFPIRDDRKRVVAFGGRALAADEKAKYINSPETPIYNKKRTLYGIDKALPLMRKSKSVYIAEGYMDVIALSAGGVENVVAPLGTAFTEEQGRILSRWIDAIYVVFDSDQAGIDATFRAAIVAEKWDLECRAVTVESGKDPAELYSNGGKTAIQRLVAQSVPVFDFLVDAALKEMPPRNERNRELLLRKLFPYINIVSSEVRREGLLSKVSDVVSVSPTAVARDFARWRKGERPQQVEELDKKTTFKTSRDLKLLLATASDGELFAYLRRFLSADDLEDEFARSIYYRIEDAFRHDEALPQGLIDRLDDEEMREYVLERITSGEFGGWSTEDVDRAIEFTRIRALQAEQRELERQLRRVDAVDIQDIRRIQGKKISIDQELAKLKVRADDRVAE